MRHLKMTSRVWRVIVSAPFILCMALLNSACESGRELQVVAASAPVPVEVFSEADIASTYVHAESSDAYCNMVQGDVFKERLIAAVNVLRASEQQCGDQILPASAPLAWSVKLQKVAYEHSSQMAITNVVSHISLDARHPADRVRAVGYRFASLAENICAGVYDVSGVIKAWLESPSHCKQMLSADYTEFGVACVKREKGYYRRYWTMNLASPLLEPTPAPVVK